MEEFSTLPIWPGRGSEQDPAWAGVAVESLGVQRVAGVHAAAWRKPLPGLRFGHGCTEAFIGRPPQPPLDLTTTTEVSPGPRELRQTQARQHPCFCPFQNSCKLQGERAVEMPQYFRLKKKIGF